MVGYPDRGCHVRLDRIFLENDPFRIVTAGRPLFHLHQYACPGGGHLRVHPRLFRPDSRTGRFHCTRTQIPDEPCFQQQCQYQCNSAGHQRTRTLTDGNSRKTIGCREKKRLRHAHSFNSSPPSGDAAEVCRYSMYYKLPAWKNWRNTCRPSCKRSTKALYSRWRT